MSEYRRRLWLWRIWRLAIRLSILRPRPPLFACQRIRGTHDIAKNLRIIGSATVRRERFFIFWAEGALQHILGVRNCICKCGLADLRQLLLLCPQILLFLFRNRSSIQHNSSSITLDEYIVPMAMRSRTGQPSFSFSFSIVSAIHSGSWRCGTPRPMRLIHSRDPMGAYSLIS